MGRDQVAFVSWSGAVNTSFRRIQLECCIASTLLPSRAARLSPGKVRRSAIMCPLHGARFELATGRCMGGGYAPLRSFEVRTLDGRVEVLVPDAAPGPQDRPAPL